MRYYEILTGLAVERSSLCSFTQSDYYQWEELMVACRVLTPDERKYLEQFKGILFKSISFGDIFRVSGYVEPPLHLFSLPLYEAVVSQGLSADLCFVPVRMAYETITLHVMAVRYEPSVYVPCLLPLPMYRSMGEKESFEMFGFRFDIDWTRCGYKVYKRGNALLVLDKSQVGERMFFRVLNEREAPLVVREDVVEWWWARGIEGFDLQEVIIE